jgi:dTDP-4-amino-4,6-dideoxygalactose transaminase
MSIFEEGIFLSEPLKKPIKVTQPLLPDFSDMCRKMKEIWDSKQLSNNGGMAVSLEQGLAGYLQASSLSVFSNGTLALQIACKVLDLSGEVITTPFTFPATVHVLAWNGLTPVFCDIDQETLNINPDCIEPLITEKTTAILPVHVYGNPCDVEKIQRIADRYGLKVLYDAAHAFGVQYRGRPIASFGDISMFSFHATKVFNTLEGGALAFNRPGLKESADRMRNFGLLPDGDVTEPGTNAKMNEVQAAVGLLLLDKVNAEIQKRKAVTAAYSALLADIPGIRILRPADETIYNYPYFVIEVDEKQSGVPRDALDEILKSHHIMARRYFYPLCSNLTCYKDLPSAGASGLPVANRAAASVLALPLYGDLSLEDVSYICSIIRDSIPSHRRRIVKREELDHQSP